VRAAWRIVAAAALLLFAIAPAAAESKSASRARVSDAPTPEWRAGPVRYIITKSEDDEYRQFKTDEDRRRFIEAFWRRRDPTPDTPGNEFRSQFWKRVREANSLYSRDSPRPGWLTDMGKIYILLGPPDEVQRDEMPEGRRGTIIWVYRSSPNVGGPRLLTGPNQVIAFAQDGTGEYRMTAEPSKMADVWEGLPDPQPPTGTFKVQEAWRRAFDKAYASYIGLSDPIIRAAGGPAQESPLGATMLLGRLQQPPKEWNLTAEVTTREFFGGLPFRARADFFKTTGELTQVTLAVGISSRSVIYKSTPLGEIPVVHVYARILDSTATDLVQALDHDGDFAPAETNKSAGLDDDLLFQTRAVLKPGSYVARLTAVDNVSGKSGTSDTPFTVPDFTSPGLELSTVVLARALEPVSGSEASSRAAFVIGNLRVTPRLGAVFEQGEDLAFYYQVYGAERDPASGQVKLNVAYSFLAPQGETLTEIGRVAFEGQTTEAHGYAIPLREWPPGEYMVRIEVTDVVAARKVSRDSIFRVVQGP